MAPRINWRGLVNHNGYDSLLVMLLVITKKFGIQRGAAHLGVSESALYLKLRVLGISFGPFKIWHFHNFPYVAQIWKARKRFGRKKSFHVRTSKKLF